MYVEDMGRAEAREWMNYFAAQVRRTDITKADRLDARRDLHDCARRYKELGRRDQEAHYR
jgi:hypothetical protein